MAAFPAIHCNLMLVDPLKPAINTFILCVVLKEGIIVFHFPDKLIFSDDFKNHKLPEKFENGICLIYPALMKFKVSYLKI